MDLHHQFISAVSDDGDSSRVRPSDWNAAHVPSVDPSILVLLEDDFLTGTGAITSGYHGAMRWAHRVTGTGSTLAVTSATAGHPGQLVLTSGNASGNSACLRAGDNDSTLNPVLPSSIHSFGAVLQLPTITSIDVVVGLLTNTATGSTPYSNDAIGIRFRDSENAAWRSWTRASASETFNAAGGSVASSTWYLLEGKKSGSDWAFYVNGSLVATHTTNIPTGALNPCVIVGTTTSAARTLTLDMFYLMVETGTRY